MHRTVDVAMALADKLKSLVPIADAHVAINCTGSEAVDFALKFMRYRNVARGEPQRRRFISRWGSYHGGHDRLGALGGGRELHDCLRPARWTISCSLASPTGRLAPSPAKARPSSPAVSWRNSSARSRPLGPRPSPASWPNP